MIGFMAKGEVDVNSLNIEGKTGILALGLGEEWGGGDWAVGRLWRLFKDLGFYSLFFV